MAESKNESKNNQSTAKPRPAVKPATSRASGAASTNILEGFFPQANNQAMEKIMSQSKSQIDKFAQETSNFTKEGLEAFSQSVTIFARGYEEIARTALALAQSSAERQAQFFNQALASKTLNELTEAQNKIAQANLDDIMSAATKLSELGIKVATESAEPLSEQIGKSIRKASDAAAA